LQSHPVGLGNILCTDIEQSLDASGGSVFRIMIGAAMLE